MFMQFSQCPPDYHHIHTEISREGARVLALGYKELGHLTHQQVRACHTQQPMLPCHLSGMSFHVTFSALGCCGHLLWKSRCLRLYYSCPCHLVVRRP